MRKFMEKIKLQYKIMGLTIIMMCLVLAIVGGWVLHNVTDYVEKSVADRALEIARIAAGMPVAQTALLSNHATDSLQPIAEMLRKSSGAAYVIYSDMRQIRLTYPVVEEIGTPMANLYREPVLRGEEYVYIGKGFLAPSLRANVPVFRQDTGEQIGYVSVGFYLDEINEITRKSLGEISYAFLLAIALGIIGAWLLATHIKKVMLGLEPHEIATSLKEKMATLEAIREGVIAVDVNNKIRLWNSEAAKILGENASLEQGRSIGEILPQNKLFAVMQTGEAVYDKEQNVGDIIIMSNSVPVVVDDKVVGAVMPFRDRAEINRMAEELTGIHRFVDMLRAQTHEFKNKLHTIAGLIQLQRYDEAVDYAIDNQVSQQEQFSQISVSIKDSVIYGLLVGKASQMKEQGIDFVIDQDSRLKDLPVSVASGDVVLIVGNLLQNAMEAVADSAEKRIGVKLWQTPHELKIEVQNTGPWIDEQFSSVIYKKGITTKQRGYGLGLALIVEKLRLMHGTIVHYNLPQGGVRFEVTIPYRF